jgi:hypothetical protein
MVYAHHLATPGVYGGNADEANVYQLDTGCTDVVGTGTPSAISWNWLGNCDTTPDPNQAKTVRMMEVFRGQFPAEEDEQVLESVTLTVNLSGPTPPSLSISLAVDAVRNSAQWFVPVHEPATSMQAEVSGATTTGGLIVAIILDVVPRGRRT